MQEVTLFAFALEPQVYLHARARLLLSKIARLQAEYADDRRRAAKYPSYKYAPLGVRTRLIERVSATLQFGNSTLMRYLQDCFPRL
jgi:hypothetical protein